MTRRFLPILVTGSLLWLTPPSAQATPPRLAFERPEADLPSTRTGHPPPPDDPLDTCGIVPAAAPDFTLEDVNSSSPTFGLEIPRTDTGNATLLYIALASCGVCQADTDALGALVAEQGDAWADLSVRVLALNTAHDSLPELADGHDLPIVVDTDALDLEAQYGAERWYIYLLDRSGQPARIHYDLNFTTERDRLIDEVGALLAGEDLP